MYQALPQSTPKTKFIQNVLTSAPFLLWITLFEKALTDSDEVVRREAIASLKYRNPTGKKTLSFLIGLLENENPKIRKEAATLIQFYYPKFHKEKSTLLNDAIHSSCEQPNLAACKKLLSDLDLILSTLMETPFDERLLRSEIGSDEQCMTPISKTDPRVAHLPKFIELGAMYQIAGLIWSEISPNEMNWKEAMDYCKEKGARLPTKEEQEALGRSFGYHVPGRTYNHLLLENSKKRANWSSSTDPSHYPLRVFSFDAYTGSGSFISSSNKAFLRCVVAGVE